jgi:hypothetical protein
VKYVRIQTEIIEAEVWLGHETRHPQVEPYEPPNLKLNETHLKCKKRWVDHGFVDPVHVHGQRSWDDGALVCPGDYLITQPSHNGLPQFTVVTGHSFEHVYQKHDDELQRPLVMSELAWERLNREQQNEVIQGAHGAGVLIMPHGMLEAHGSSRT